jgi:LacI family transcriptional regulator
MREIAAQVGVSLKTVSRVFNGDPHVRPEIRERVQQALVENHYVPNELAQTFRSGKGRVIGITVPDLLDPFFAAIVAAVGAAAQLRGYGTLVTAAGFDPADEQSSVTSLLSRRVAGLILAPGSADQSYLSAAVPIVLVDQPAAGARLDSFVHEDRRGGALATVHLLDHGYRRIGFLGRAPHLATSSHRLDGYRDALRDADIDADDTLVIADVDTPASGAEAYAELRRRGVDALFSADPRTTIACLPAAKSDRVALVGFGDFPLADLLTPSISVVDQSPAIMGKRAAEHLLDLIEQDDNVRSERELVTLPVSLIERESCRAGQ